MNITLKQSDIEQAVKMFVERQGISLHNKSLAIDFAMGRGKNGLSASLIIDDVAVPGFTSSEDDEPKITNIPTGPIKRSSGEVRGIQASSDVGLVGNTVSLAVVDGVVEKAIAAPATMAEVQEAGLATAAIATPATEAAVAAPVAEAKVAEAPVEAPAKTTTSLFGAG